jgi:IclR family KDG regulon transcriptional repressor
MVILEAVASEPMRASDIVQRLGLKWTTAHRSLTYLLENRYLRRDEQSGIYSIGPHLYALGQAYLLGHPLLDAGTLALRNLAHETGGTAQLNERDGFEATVLMAVDERLELIPKTTSEYQFPLHAGSKGQVLLAYSDPSVFLEMTREPLPRLTDETIVDPSLLYDRLAEIRLAGHATTSGDVQRGTASVAAPVLDQSGSLVGAICVIKRSAEITKKSAPSIVSAVSLTARDISTRLGWRPGVEAACVAAWNATPRPGAKDGRSNGAKRKTTRASTKRS